MTKEDLAYKALDSEMTEGQTTEGEKKMFIQGFLQGMGKSEEMLELISNIAYLYKDSRLKNTYFFQQDKVDLEFLLTFLRDNNYKDSKYGFVRLDDLISKLDKDGYLPNELLPRQNDTRY